MAKVLGISAFYHDSAAALIIDGEIIAAVQEERFNRIKHSQDFPIQAIQFCLKKANLKLTDLDAIVFYDKPLLKFERLIESYYAFAPKGFFSFLKSMPLWLHEKLFLKQKIQKYLTQIEEKIPKKLPILFSEHHLSHAASAFYASPFHHSAILVIDGVGEWATISIAKGNGEKIEIIKEQKFPHSLGLLYSAFTWFLGFKVNEGEYKLMGLAPYGDKSDHLFSKYVALIKQHLIDIKADGSVWLNQNFFSYVYDLKMLDEKKWENIFELKRRNEFDEIKAEHCHLALAIQSITEEIVLKLASEAKKITGSENLCLAGGVALNCTANGVLKRANISENIFVQPASGDAGGALGAAWSAEFMYFEGKRKIVFPDLMQNAFLGPDFNDSEIETFLQKENIVFKKFNQEDLIKQIAKHLYDGLVLGWFQGKAEFGPRALGNRSILANPIAPNMQQKLNLKIKFRESFRPFAPAILEEKVNEYFELDNPSEYMLFTAFLKQKWREKLPENFNQSSWSEKLKIHRSVLQAIVHVDFSARIQTVNQQRNPQFYDLIKNFEQLSGFPILVNTSFNVKDEPPVLTPFDAYQCFVKTEMDVLVLGNYLIRK